MIVCGIESSCDECAVALVEDGTTILGQVVATQTEFHAPFQGVVPEIASRKHTEWILPVYRQALEHAHIDNSQIDAIAVTVEPGLAGSLLVGLSFAKALALTLGVPFVGINHILAHLYAPRFEGPLVYPFLGLLVSGGHTIIARVDDPFDIEILGTTIDDACGEAFDKVAKHLDLGYPGGVVIDRLAADGDDEAFAFPIAPLSSERHRYDVSYSGLKTAVVYQLERFHVRGAVDDMANVAASFQRAAIEMLLGRLFQAVADTGIGRVVVGGGVAANSYLRRRLGEAPQIEARMPAPSLCTDNAAMVAGLGYVALERGITSPLTINASSRVPGFRRPYA